MPILCARWKRGHRVNGRWPRTRSRWLTRPDARAHFHCCGDQGGESTKKRMISEEFLFSFEVFSVYGQSIEFSAALCRITTKLQYKECFLEITQDLLKLIGVEVCDRLNVLYVGI